MNYNYELYNSTTNNTNPCNLSNRHKVSDTSGNTIGRFRRCITHTRHSLLRGHSIHVSLLSPHVVPHPSLTVARTSHVASPRPLHVCVLLVQVGSVHISVHTSTGLELSLPLHIVELVVEFPCEQKGLNYHEQMKGLNNHEKIKCRFQECRISIKSHTNFTKILNGLAGTFHTQVTTEKVKLTLLTNEF